MSRQKSQWGPLKGVWVPHDKRDAIVDYMKYWPERTELPVGQLLAWADLATSKYHSWKNRYGQANDHSGKIPRDWWLEQWEKDAIVAYHDQNPLEGYRRLTFRAPTVGWSAR
jgi:putative transposase